MLGIITELKDMMADLVEAKLLIEGQCPGIVLPDAKPDLISVASHCSRVHLGHERSSNTLALPPLVDIDALDLGWPHRRYARRRDSPSELGVANELSAVVAYEGLDLRTGNLRRLNGFAIRVRTMSVHVAARMEEPKVARKVRSASAANC